ncbi:MAG: hypothetical protein ACRCW9_06585 [Cetobacterium sp.]
MKNRILKYLKHELKNSTEEFFDNKISNMILCFEQYDFKELEQFNNSKYMSLELFPTTGLLKVKRIDYKKTTIEFKLFMEEYFENNTMVIKPKIITKIIDNKTINVENLSTEEIKIGLERILNEK